MDNYGPDIVDKLTIAVNSKSHWFIFNFYNSIQNFNFIIIFKKFCFVNNFIIILYLTYCL